MPVSVTWYALGQPPIRAAGDIIIHSGTGNQFRSNGTSWVPMQPGESRADIMPSIQITGSVNGLANTHLAKASGNPFALTWVNPSDGIVVLHTEATPRNPWPIVHQLQNPWVDVMVYSPGANDPSAEQTIIFPTIEPGQTQFAMTLRFAGPVAGTAVIRR
jgi:hypothetical protein